ncbi:MAG: thioesterase family protein [Desulfotomaculum sp.]|nr:thioesterase family protein [Desulfotomaculum sp.]MCL0081583.1 thioesterase family protein [Peptococcaceae bacterium]
MDKLKVGIKGEAKTTVTKDNTALAYGSGSVAVLATPAMIGLMEKAALASIEPCLEKGQSTVGIMVKITHTAATPVGMTATASSELIEIDKRKLVFKIEARDEREVIGEGTHERFIIDVNKFLAKVAAK